MTEAPGNMVGRYRIDSKLGAGGMAQVFKAFDTRLERPVALKVITDNRQGSEKFLKRFDREAKSLAKLSHPNIVDVHDYGEVNGNPYIVMEYLPNGTLKKRMGQPIDYKKSAKLLIPIANALDYAHKQGVVHRDIKPANLLLTEQNILMVSDFGIAKVITRNSEEALTQVGTGIGTPSYMSPEQGQGQEIDARTDVYALGVVFYEMLTGIKPYEAPTPTGVFWKQMTEPLPDPKKIIPDLPDEVVDFLKKALAANVDERIQSMSEFSKTLEHFTQPSAPANYAEAATAPVDRSAATVADPGTKSEEISFPQGIQTPDLNAAYDSGSTLPPAPNITPKPEKKKKTWVIFAVLGALLVVAALCIGGIILIANLPDSTDDAEPTVEVISQPETQPEAQPTAVTDNQPENLSQDSLKECAQTAGSPQYSLEAGYRPVFCDTFEDNTNQWVLKPANTDYIESSASLQNGVFRLEMTGKQDWAQYWLWLHNPETGANLLTGNFLMEFKIRKTNGTTNSFIGVDYRELENDTFYSATVYESSDLITLEYYDSQSYTTLEDIPLTNWSDSGWNTLTIAATGPAHGVYANSDYLEAQDGTIVDPGALSIWIGTITAGESVTYEIDDIVVYRVTD